MATSKVGVSGNKFTQTFPATTIYWHTCKWTGKLFCSPVRRLTYSPEGERLKKEFDKTVIAARRLSCRVYFRQCPETGEFFTTRDRNELRSEEGKRIRRERELRNFREYSKRPEVKAREAARSCSDKRKASQRRYAETNRQKVSERGKQRYQAKRASQPALTSCFVYFLTCKETGKLFASRTRRASYSKEGLKIKAKREYDSKNASIVHECTCKICKTTFSVPYGNKTRLLCSAQCRTRNKTMARRGLKHYRSRAKHYGVEYVSFNIYEVFERDKWICQLCGIPTPKDLRGTINDTAPELDHVIPLSKGGPHIQSNVQCACRKCNISKGASVINQLELVL